MKEEEVRKSGISETLSRIEKYIIIGTKNVLTLDEAAILLGVQKRTVKQMVADNIIPAYKPNRRAVYFKKSELEGWMLQNRIKTQAEIESEAAALYSVIH